VEIWVKDNGAGMTPEVLSKIFDPFFTTKEPGEGTGLGLAISSLILEQFGARLTVESELGKGTTCTITFPLKEEPYIKDQAA
jgi:signal transduction histidine kinase